MGATDPLTTHAQALLDEIVGRPDLFDATGTYDLDVAGRPVRVTVTADEGGPFVAGRVVRVLVEDAGRVGYAAGFHGGVRTDSRRGRDGHEEGTFAPAPDAASLPRTGVASAADAIAA